MSLKTPAPNSNWHLNRLLLMSPIEVGYRIKERIRNSFGQLFFKDTKPKTSLSKKDTNWFFNLQDKEAVCSFFKDKNLWDESKARELLEHRFSFFSFDDKFLGETINWNKDYKNDKEAPLKYCKDIDYRIFSEVGDIKYIWEINRHQHLISLAKAYYLTGEQRYKDEVIKQVLSWVEANPYKKGANWISSLELAVRLISWSWAWVFLGDTDEEFKQIWLGSIYKHCVFISQNFSRYSSANNHLIGEAAGLFIASILWPFGKESEKWQKKSFRILVNEAEKQNYEDGVNKEQAVSYQGFVLEFLMLAGLLGEKNGVTFPDIYWERMEKMFSFIASIMDKNGNVPNIGDSDDGHAVILAEKELNSYQPLLSTGAVKFARGDFADKAGRFYEESFWLLGIEGWENFNALDKKSFIPLKAFEKGGYYILSALEGAEDEIKSVFDCGPLGYLSIAAHGHSDALSFTLSVGGEEFFIDPGTYAYHTKKNWRDYFKGTSAHNTILIDGENQSVSGGNFMWLKKAEARLIKHEVLNDHEKVIGEHDGYMRLGDPVLHQREMSLEKRNNVIIIYDRIRAREKHLIKQYLHLSHKCSVKDAGNNTWQIRNGKYCINLSVDKKFDTKLVYGSDDPMLGWESKRFDVKNKTAVLVNSCEQHGDCDFVTTISVVKQ